MDRNNTANREEGLSSAGRLGLGGLRASAIALSVLLFSGTFGSLILSSLTPPNADAGADIVSDLGIVVHLSGVGSTGSGPLNFTWFLGDGTTRYGVAADHTYGTEGVYQATLVVRDKNGKYDLDTADVTVVNEVPQADAGLDRSVVEDATLAFSGSAWDTNNDLPLLTYVWNFGDGSSPHSGATAQHAYARAGSYAASLTVTDDQGSFSRDYVLVTVENGPPVASFVAPADVQEDELVSLDASASTDTPSDLPGLSHGWDFGDGALGAGLLATHVYTRAGSYTINLTVIDDNAAADSVERIITVRNAPPVADAGSDTVVDEGSTVRFDAMGTSDTPTDIPALVYEWDLDGDGVSDAEGMRPTHNYDDDASVHATLVATDDDGAASTDQREVAVRNVPPHPAITAFGLHDSTVVDFTLRMAGEKWHDASMALEEDGVEFARVNVFRNPGDPKDQEASVSDVVVHMASDYLAIMTYTPENDPVNGQPNGASPAWVLLDLDDGREVSFHHTFNAKHPETWTWSLDLASIVRVDLEGTVFDPSSDGQEVTWKFGDGDEQMTAYPDGEAYPARIHEAVTHVYVLPGTHVVILESLDDDGGLGAYALELTVTPDGSTVDDLAPSLAVTGSTSGVEDATLAYGATASDPEGDPVSFEWDFGDASCGIGAAPTHRFTHEGAYLVIATAQDGSGRTNRDAVWTQVVNLPPTASVTGTSVAREDEVSLFDASGSDDTHSDRFSLRFAWDFGDGAKGAGESVSHAYSRQGTYLVSATVSDDNGQQATTHSEVSIQNAPPQVEVGPGITRNEDEALVFSVEGSDTESDVVRLIHQWDLGAGRTAVGRTVVARFSNPGEWDIALTVTDDDGASATDSFHITLNNVPPVAYVSSPFNFYGSAKTFSYRASAYDTYSDRVLTSWEFDEGTGFVSSGTHAYGVDGSHLGRLAAIDDHLAAVAVPFVANAILDTDGDQLRDDAEIAAGTNPGVWDSDGDGLPDSYELFLLDREACIQLYGEEACLTNPTKFDTDSDGLSDWEELWSGADTFLTNPTNNDTDGDALTDGEEFVGFRVAIRDVSHDDILPGIPIFGIVIPRTTVVPFANFGIGAPTALLKSAELDLQLTHPDVSKLKVTFGYNPSVVLWNGGASGTSLHLTCDVLTQFGPSPLATKRTWTLTIRNSMPGSGHIGVATLTVTFQSSPVAADVDGDGLQDGEEAEGYTRNPTNPWSSDSDGDGIEDALDGSPTKVWALPWALPFEPGLVRFRPEYGAYSVHGLWAHIWTYNYFGDNCVYLSDHTSDATRNSDESPQSVVNAANKILADGGETNYTATNAELLGSASWGVGTYHYGGCVWNAPRQYRIAYLWDEHRFNISFVNVKPVPIPDENGDLFYHTPVKVPLTSARPQSFIIQATIASSKDRTTGSGSSSSVTPALAYTLHRNSNFQQEGPVYRNLAMGVAIADHSYQFSVRIPREWTTTGNTENIGGIPHITAVLTPVWLERSGDNFQKSALNATYLTVGSAVTQAAESAGEFIARQDVNLDVIRAAFPGFDTLPTGYHSSQGYTLYVYRLGDGVDFDAGALQTAHAVYLGGESAEEVQSRRDSIAWTASWLTNGNDAFGNPLKLFKSVGHSLKLGRELYANLLQDIEAKAWTRFQQMKDQRIAIEVVDYFNIDQMKTFYAATKTQRVTVTDLAPSWDNPYVMVKSTRVEVRILGYENVDDPAKIKMFDELKFKPLKDDYAKLRALKGAGVAITMVIFGGEAVLAWTEGDVVKASFYVAAGATAVFGIVKGEVTLLKIGGESGILKGASLKVGAVAAVAVGAILAGYELFAASQTDDPILKLSHYEAAGAAVIDSIISAIPVYGAAIQAGWFLGVQVGVLLGSLMGIAPNALAYKIVSSPGSTIVFLFEYVFATGIPSDVAADALSKLLNFLVDTATYNNAHDHPSIVLFPP